jgi:hypothetical protein
MGLILLYPAPRSGSTEFRQSSLLRSSEFASLLRVKPALTPADRRDLQGVAERGAVNTKPILMSVPSTSSHVSVSPNHASAASSSYASK